MLILHESHLSRKILSLIVGCLRKKQYLCARFI